MNYYKLEAAIIEQVQKICKKYLDKNKIKQIVDNENNSNDKESKIKKEKSAILKYLEILDMQVDNLYEDKLNKVISAEDFERLYNNKINERDEKKKQLVEFENMNFERNIVDYEKIMTEFLKAENITNYMLTSLIDKIEIDDKKQVTINYKFSPLNDLS